jgi:hypothetical protein
MGRGPSVFLAFLAKNTEGPLLNQKCSEGLKPSEHSCLIIQWVNYHLSIINYPLITNLAPRLPTSQSQP